MHKRILIAVDLAHSDLSATAVESAEALARQSGAELHVAAIVPDFGMSIVGGFFSKDFEKQALAHAKAELDAFVAGHVDSALAPKTHLGHGHVTEQILAMAKKVDADLIVIGSRQPDQMQDLMVGSNANRLARSSPVSLLIVRG